MSHHFCREHLQPTSELPSIYPFTQARVGYILIRCNTSANHQATRMHLSFTVTSVFFELKFEREDDFSLVSGMKWRRSCQRGSAVEKQWHALYGSHCSWNAACPPRSNTLIFLFVRSRSRSVNALVSSWCRDIGTTNIAASVAWEHRMRGKTKCLNCYKL